MEVELELAHESSCDGDGCEGDSIFFLMFAEDFVTLVASLLLLLLRFNFDFIELPILVLFGGIESACKFSNEFALRVEECRIGGDFFIMN